MGTTENAVVMRRIFKEVINGARLDLTEELYTEDHALHPAAAGVGPGAAGMREAFAGLHQEFADARAEIESLVAEGETVAVRATFSGTHRESGERIYWPEMVFTRFVDGKAAESWEVTDTGRTWTEAPW
jgi:predicted SnoaL-like aldol condensation-catalyzing enzyme